jgi:bifunctional non-homologous end joining protein LigD
MPKSAPPSEGDALLRLERDGERVRLITRCGHNWADRYPSIVEAARNNRATRFIIDGEAVVLGVDGVADFNALHSRKHDTKCSSTP